MREPEQPPQVSLFDVTFADEQRCVSDVTAHRAARPHVIPLEKGHAIQ